MLSFCVYICAGIWLCVCDVHSVIIGKSNLPALQLPSLQQLERGEPEFSMSMCSVTVGTCEKSDSWTTHTQSHFLLTRGAMLVVISLQNVPLTP